MAKKKARTIRPAAREISSVAPRSRGMTIGLSGLERRALGRRG